jgi:hypothetical protein
MSTTTGPRDHGAYGAPPAPVGRRVAASLLDGALTSVCAAPLLAAVLPVWLAAARAADGTTSPVPAGPSPVLLVVALVLLLAWGAVQWWCHGTRGWTVGRRLLGLRTVDVRHGRPVGLGRALVRSLVVVAGVLACGVGQLVVLLSPLFDSSGRHRGWHDRVADAVVVDVRGLVAARRASAPAVVPRPVTGALAVPVLTPPDAAVAPPAPAAPLPLPRDAAAPLPSGTARPAPDGPAGPGRESAGPGRESAWPSAAPGGVPHQTSPDPGLSPDLDLLPGPRPAVAPEPLGEPPAPTRTRWTTLAAGRQLDAPDLVLPALGRPGLGPDLDTRQLPAVGATGQPVPPAPSVPPAGALPVTDAGAARPAPDPLPAWTPPPPVVPRPDPPDPLDLAVPWPDGAPPVGRAPDEPSSGGESYAPTLSAPPPPPPPPSSTVPVEAFPDPAPVAASGASAWSVRLPDGAVVGLDVPLLVGRNPAPVPGARLVAVADPGRSVSKTHLMLGVDEHGPWVVDRGSTNGTLVTLGDGQRIVCLADRRVRLTDGSLISFGDLSLSVRNRV